MARPIAYNASGPLSGSIRGGSVNYTIDGAGRDYTTFAGKKWVPSADGAAPIIFVTDSFTRGLTTAVNAYPLFFSCAGTGSDAILYTANRLPGSPGNFTDTGSAFYDLGVTYGYFILEGNDPYQGDYGSGNYLTLDASKTTSYPQTLSKFFDLSGNGFTFDLINGPTWDNNGWFAMDGTDDSIFASSPATAIKATKTTLVMWFRTTDTVGLLLSGQPPYAAGAYYVGAWAGGSGFYQSNCGSPTYYIDTEQVSDPLNPVAYNDGRFHMWEAKDLTLGSWTNNWNFGGYDSSYSIVGDIAKIEIYSSSLSPEQSKQNYFGSQIVTDGLVFAVDANNIISYPKSGTTTYSLTGSLTGTLTNGVGYLPNNGGTWNFDGTDDFILVPNGYSTVMQGNDYWTVSVWVNANDLSNAPVLISPGAGQLAYSDLYLEIDPNNIYMAASGGPLAASITLSTNTWYHITWVKDGPTTGYIYLNGVRLNTTGTIGAMANTAADFRIGAFKQGSYYLNGKMPSVLMYNKALTATEIQQNYQAEQYRFEGPAGPVTNGLLLYWDAGNLDSYPGTGTTIYDLSGNGNNGNVVNGVGYNQTNGGVLTFDGIDDQVYLSTLNLTSTNNTVMGAARYTGTSPHGRMINSLNNNWLLGQWNNSTLNYYAEGTVYGIPAGPDDTNWRIYTGTGDISGDSWGFYVNNSLITQNNAGVQGPNGISIARQGFGAEWSTGQFSFLLIYNRVLTAAEMTQNYNYFKGRFGL
jgi:hypothetical protein